MKKCLDCGEEISPNAERCSKCSKIGELSNIWKGDKVGNYGLHAWVRRHKTKPQFCECCGVTEPYDLANISGKYLRDVNDFEWICRRCHMKKDGRAELVKKNLKQYKRICDNCHKEIKKEDKFVSIITFEKEYNVIEEVNMHFQCWIDYFHACLDKKLMVAKEKALGMVKSMFPMITGGTQKFEIV